MEDFQRFYGFSYLIIWQLYWIASNGIKGVSLESQFGVAGGRI